MVQLRGINKSYTVGSNRLHVLKGVDLEIGDGEMVSIMGRRARASRRCSTSWASWTASTAVPTAWATS